ncbi:GntR family transcriptional regulator [Rhodococcus sp. 06-418-5]|uniref:GntR family transcriptional regulator n=1 Tax=Rhodococcus sp. 06-418-5 TaxID=2022507 RepID=UPI000B9C2A49|nr:GntR family transcriptional regulator [Rhodococcus sp. 06-418-5]OZC81545.1 GntR family transcriptional regulator [Rhodococcus sp. 06-418-5]
MGRSRTSASTSTTRALTAIRDLVFSGELAPGARLGEVELAELLGVSRTPVREALRQLAAEGLIDLSPNRGARVISFSTAELDSVFELRSTLEPKMTGLAAARATESDIAELDDLARSMVKIGTPGAGQDLDALVPLNRSFHDRLIDIAASPAFATALAGAIRAPIVLRNFHAYDAESLQRSLAGHVEIVDAIRAGDAIWAAAVMTSHIRSARAVMLRSAAHLPSIADSDMNP